jgi:hypothetical protein
MRPGTYHDYITDQELVDAESPAASVSSWILRSQRDESYCVNKLSVSFRSGAWTGRS